MLYTSVFSIGGLKLVSAARGDGNFHLHSCGVSINHVVALHSFDMIVTNLQARAMLRPWR
jgi:hypothetical protein